MQATLLKPKYYHNPKKKITSYITFRTPSHPHSAGDSVQITMECGHKKCYKASEAPKKMEFAFCKECRYFVFKRVK